VSKGQKTPSEAAIDAWTRLMRAQRKALSGVEADMKAAGFPPLAWYDVLLELKKAGDAGLRPVELEDRLLLEQHNVSRLVDRLAAAGHVLRRPCLSDRRGHMLALTESGRSLLREMWPAYREAIQRHVGSRIGCDDDAKQLATLLDRLTGST
jgi:DNA-binding MarR family transcriptional regulator